MRGLPKPLRRLHKLACCSITITTTTTTTKYGQLTFKNFFAAFINKIKLNRKLYFISNFQDYKSMVLSNLSIIYADFKKRFDILNIKINFSFFIS